MHNKQIEISSYIFMTVLIIFTFLIHLMSTVIIGMVVFILIKKLYNKLNPKLKNKNSQKITLGIVIFIVVLLTTASVFGVMYAIKSSHSSTQYIIEQAFIVLQEIKKYLPQIMLSYIPDDVMELKEKIINIFNEQKIHIFEITTNSLKLLVHSIIGIIIGAIISFSFLGFEKEKHEMKPLAEAIYNRINIFTNVVEKVVFAQGKISVINTILTAIYLLIILPLFGIYVPYSKTLIILTFCMGLIPVLGNLISNTFIVLMSLILSFKVAIGSLIFLIIIHKLEYYINAKIVGSKIKTAIWELLIAMIIMESLFGLMGVAIAPIIYGYIKEEFKLLELI
jgi:predicted PurR-regulated permease PerM